MFHRRIYPSLSYVHYMYMSLHTCTCMCMYCTCVQTNLSREEGGDTEQEIAKRTRSKCPLHDVSITSLEAGLSTVEGEDPPTPRELDPDELWWHQWLNSLSSDPLSGKSCDLFKYVYMYCLAATLLMHVPHTCVCSACMLLM